MSAVVRTLFLSLALVAGLLVTGTAQAAACPTGWGSTPEAVATMGTGELDTVRAGRDVCWDRVVLDIDGPAAGYRAEYVAAVTVDGSGAPVTVPGGARIQLVANHPSFAPRPIGSSMASTAGFDTVKSVIYAGSFEGQTTIGVGTRARLPFRVFTLAGGHGRVVLDVARTW
jgi:hypothetical protein